jgi:phenylacetate-coenzyme A ligase PaaK-like adenylate-forming protein
MKISNPHLEKLLASGPYDMDADLKQELLMESVIHELNYHRDNNELIKRYFDKKSYKNTNVQKFDSLPYIPARAFKNLGELFISGDKKSIVSTLQSSATSGTPSVVKIDKETSRRQVKALALVLADRLGKHRRPFLIMDVDPSFANPLTIGARGAAVKGFLNLASSAAYFMSEEKGGLQFDIDKFRDHLSQIKDEGVIIFGFTYVIYAELIEKLMAENIKIKLPENSMFVHIGGWKKLEDRKVSKAVFNKTVSDIFSIPEDHVVDFYGFTEQMGVTYPDCECGWKHTPSFAEILIRNEANQEIVPDGTQGMIELITPIPHSYPGNVVLTDDLGVIASESEPPCTRKRSGTRFKILGRIKKSEPRGCGDVMADKIFKQDDSTLSTEDKQIDLLYAHDQNQGPINSDELERILKNLSTQHQWLKNQKIDLLIGLISKVSRKWENKDFSLAELQNQGLSFLIQWCTSENLKKITHNALQNRAYMDQFLPFGELNQKFLKALPKGIAVHWLSGNVPVLGMLVLIQAIITKNLNVLKASHSYSPVIPLLLKEFEGEIYESPGGERISGDELLKTIAVVYFKRTNMIAANMLSQAADIRIAWGGKEAVETVSALPRKYSTSDIVFGPKLSFMAIGRESLKEDRKLRRLIKNTAIDASVFNQTACASPHTIFIEKNGEISPKEFASRLSIEMDKIANRIPNLELDNELVNHIETVRTIYDFKGEVWKPADASWTVLYDEDFALADPSYGRVICVKAVDDIFSTVSLIDDNIQTIGLAIKGKRRLEFAELAAEKGADRFPVIGMMTHFEDPWDGLFVIQNCVNWKTLGGPL